ncbi:MAG: hypothetical protein DMF24_07970 [Verrucomicrobia bacterium]|nr:MAG: hypothetical protein DMF24_07970 [Verrucomicrobiota bacterium]
MKPILQVNPKQRGSRRDNRLRRSHQNFPLTDYNYRPTAESQVNSSAGWRATKAPAFYKLSSEFFEEGSRDYVAELLFFLLITGIAAWPVVSMLIAVTRMIRNY